MLVDYFPLVGLRLVTPRLELRIPSLAELADLADVAAAGIHPPGQMPFSVPWTDAPPVEVGRNVIQYYLTTLGTWTPTNWSLNLVVFHAGRPVGQQSLGARDFAITREVGTGSWLGRAHQGQGIGTEMRAAVLHLAFAGLAAQEAVSGAMVDNPASLRVSRKLGYRPDGITREVVQGRAVTIQRLRLSRADWQATRTMPVTIEGLTPCLPLFGVEEAADTAG